MWWEIFSCQLLNFVRIVYLVRWSKSWSQPKYVIAHHPTSRMTKKNVKRNIQAINQELSICKPIHPSQFGSEFFFQCWFYSALWLKKTYSDTTPYIAFSLTFLVWFDRSKRTFMLFVVENETSKISRNRRVEHW